MRNFTEIFELIGEKWNTSGRAHVSTRAPSNDDPIFEAIGLRFQRAILRTFISRASSFKILIEGEAEYCKASVPTLYKI